jgi:tetrahydromethanopterin S-methyltransferase subunit E
MTLISVLRPDIIDPPREALTLAPRAELPDNLVIGLVCNGKPLANELLHAVGEQVAARLQRKATFEFIEKISAGVSVSAIQADGMAARAHFVITGVGD